MALGSSSPSWRRRRRPARAARARARRGQLAAGARRPGLHRHGRARVSSSASDDRSIPRSPSSVGSSGSTRSARSTRTTPAAAATRRRPASATRSRSRSASRTTTWSARGGAARATSAARRASSTAAFFPALMWNGRFSAPSGDPFDNGQGFLFPAPEGATAFPAADPIVTHLLIAQAHIPPTELVEVAGFTGTSGTIGPDFDAFDDGLGSTVPPPDGSGFRNEPIRAAVLARLNAVAGVPRPLRRRSSRASPPADRSTSRCSAAPSPSSSSRSSSPTPRSTASRAASAAP